MALGKPITVRILGDASGLEKTLKQSAGKFDEWGSKLTSMGTRLTAGITLPLVGAAKVVWDEWSGTQEVLAQTEAVIKSTGGAAGWSAEQVNDLALRLMDITGINDDDIQNVSNVLMTFTNIKGDNLEKTTAITLDLAQALDMDLKSAAIMVGKAFNDPVQGVTALRRAGVQLTDEQEDLIKSMVESGDIVGAQGLIHEELAKQVGGSAEAFGDTLPGQLQKTKNELLNSAAALLEKLMPALQRLVEIGATVADWLANLDPKWQTIIVGALALAAALGPLLLILGGMMTGLSALAGVLGFIVSPIGLIIVAIIALGAALVWLYNNNETFRNAMQAAWDWIRDTVIPIVQQVASWLIDKLGAALDWLINEGWPALRDAAETAWGWIRDNVLPIVEEVASFIESTIGDTVEWFKEIWPDIQEAAQMFWDYMTTMWSAVAAVIGWAVEFIKGTITTAWDIITFLTQGWGDNIIGVITAAWEFIKGIVTAAIEVIRQIIGFFLNIITGDWGGAWENIKAIFGAVWDAIWATLTFVWELIKNVLGAGLDSIKNIWSAAWQWIKDRLSDAWEGIKQKAGEGLNWVIEQIKSLPGKLLGLVGTLAGAAASLGRAIIDGIKDGITGAVGFVGDIAGALWRAVKDLVNSQVIDRINNVIPNDLSLGPFSVDLPDNPIPRLATGGYIGSMALVGEHGPELFMPTERGRIEAAQSRAARAAAAVGASGRQVIVYASTDADPHAIADEVAWVLRTSGR